MSGKAYAMFGLVASVHLHRFVLPLDSLNVGFQPDIKGVSFLVGFKAVFGVRV
jgi:hypothetical protein